MKEQIFVPIKADLFDFVVFTKSASCFFFDSIDLFDGVIYPVIIIILYPRVTIRKIILIFPLFAKLISLLINLQILLTPYESGA